MNSSSWQWSVVMNEDDGWCSSAVSADHAQSDFLFEANRARLARQGSACRQTGPQRRREEPGAECHPDPERAQDPAGDVGPRPVSDRPDRISNRPRARPAAMASPRVRSFSGVAQSMVFQRPCTTAWMSKNHKRRPLTNHMNSPRLPSISPERISMRGPTKARHPASVERLESNSYGGQVSLAPLTKSAAPQRSAAPTKTALATAGFDGEAEIE